MVRNDWYRNEDWSPDIESEFFARLDRARSQRDQYLVIQALTLATSHPGVALRLLELYYGSRRNHSHMARALLANARARVSLGELDVAVAVYLDLLEHEREHPAVRTGVELDLPYLIATKRMVHRYALAQELLEQSDGNFTWPVALFKWSASLAIIFSETGRKDAAKKYARIAVEAAEIRKSGFRYHQNLGLVESSDRQTVKTMYRLAG